MGATAAGGRRGAACGLATSTRPRAGREPPLREVRESTLGAGTLHLTDWESGRAGTGRGPIVDRRPSSSGRKAWGRPCGGAREFGAGVATLAFPDTGRLGSVPWAARGPGAGLGRRVTPAGLGLGPGGRARASGQRRRRAAGTPSSWSGGGQRAGDVSRGSGGISRGLGLKVSGD